MNWNLKYLKKRKLLVITIIFAVVFCMDSYAVWAGGSDDIEMVSVELPTMEKEGNSLLDFILDPQGLITATNAVRYGGMYFEEGATLYFKNSDGPYDYSKNSDQLIVTNRGEEVIEVTISAQITDLGNAMITRDKTYAEDVRSSIYLAIVDSRGSEIAFDENGWVSITVVVEPGVEGKYAFGLTGSCNSNADWTGVNVTPQLSVMWTIDSLHSDVLVCNEEVNFDTNLNEVPEVEDVSSGDAITVSSGDIES